MRSTGVFAASMAACASGDAELKHADRYLEREFIARAFAARARLARAVPGGRARDAGNQARRSGLPAPGAGERRLSGAVRRTKDLQRCGIGIALAAREHRLRHPRL